MNDAIKMEIPRLAIANVSEFVVDDAMSKTLCPVSNFIKYGLHM